MERFGLPPLALVVGVVCFVIGSNLAIFRSHELFRLVFERNGPPPERIEESDESAGDGPEKRAIRDGPDYEPTVRPEPPSFERVSETTGDGRAVKLTWGRQQIADRMHRLSSAGANGASAGNNQSANPGGVPQRPRFEGCGGGSRNAGTARRPRVVPQRPRVEGSLDKPIIRKVVRQHRREIRYCYEKQLHQEPGLEGRVEVQFTVAASGDVVAVLVEETTLENAALEQCMQQKIRKWSFPAWKGEGVVKVNYPFEFSR